jgi:hypothetical protein
VMASLLCTCLLCAVSEGLPHTESHTSYSLIATAGLISGSRRVRMINCSACLFGFLQIIAQ